MLHYILNTTEAHLTTDGPLEPFLARLLSTIPLSLLRLFTAAVQHTARVIRGCSG